MLTMTIILKEGLIGNIKLRDITCIRNINNSNSSNPNSPREPEDLVLFFKNSKAFNKAINKTGWQKYQNVENTLLMKFYQESGYYICSKTVLSGQFFNEWLIMSD